MNKRALLKFIIVLIGLIISIGFIISYNGYYDNSNFIFVVDLMVAITVIMYNYKEKIKKNNFIYDVVLLLLMFFCFLWIGFLIFIEIQMIFSVNQVQEYFLILEPIFPTFLFLIAIFSFIDIFNKTNKTNDILCIVVFIVLIIIYSRMFLDLNINFSYFESIDSDSIKKIYINNNYLWFIIMIIILLVHHKIFNENKITKKLK